MDRTLPCLVLRMPLHTFESAAAWSQQMPGRTASLLVDRVSLEGGGAEFLVREWLAVPPEEVAQRERHRVFELQWAADPTTAVCHRLAHLCRGGYAGCLCFGMPGGNHPARGFACRGVGAGADWLLAAEIAGPGMQTLPMMDDLVDQHESAMRWLGTRTIAVAGRGAATAIVQALVELGAPHLISLDERCDGAADASGGVVAALSRARADVVIGCETDPLRRAALSAWCEDRQRVLIDVAQGVPSARAGDGPLATCVRVQEPGLARAPMRLAPSAADHGELFDGAATLAPLSAAALERARAAMQQQAARVAVQMLLDLLNGRRPPPVRVQVHVAGLTGALCVAVEFALDGHATLESVAPAAGADAAKQ